MGAGKKAILEKLVVLLVSPVLIPEHLREKALNGEADHHQAKAKVIGTIRKAAKVGIPT